MKTREQLIDEIVSKQKQIAKALSLAYADGNIEKAQEYFEVIYPRIAESKPFVFKEVELTKYEKNLKAIHDKINSQLGYDMGIFFYDSPVQYDFDPLKANVDGIDKQTENKLHKMYKHVSKTFLRANITYQNYIDMYKNKGFLYAEELYLSFLELQNRLEFKTIKRVISNFDFKNNINFLSEKLINIIDTYKIKSMDDLMNLYTEASSVLHRDEAQTDEEIEILNSNIDKLTSRPNIKELIKNKSSLEYLTYNLEKIYSDTFMKDCIEKSNVEEFLKRYNYSFNGKNVRRLMNDYLFMQTCEAFVGCENLDKKMCVPVFFKEATFRKNTASQLNRVILHEFAHVTERNATTKEEYFNSFAMKYPSLNEALTDYLAMMSLDYLDEYLLKPDEETFRSKSSYRFMLPMVERLKHMDFWQKILHSKLDDNCFSIENEIGVQNSKRLGKVFEKVYSKTRKRNFNIEKEYLEFQEVLEDIESYQFNKRVAFNHRKA